MEPKLKLKPNKKGLETRYKIYNTLSNRLSKIPKCFIINNNDQDYFMPPAESEFHNSYL